MCKKDNIRLLRKEHDKYLDYITLLVNNPESDEYKIWQYGKEKHTSYNIRNPSIQLYVRSIITADISTIITAYLTFEPHEVIKHIIDDIPHLYNTTMGYVVFDYFNYIDITIRGGTSLILSDGDTYINLVVHGKAFHVYGMDCGKNEMITDITFIHDSPDTYHYIRIYLQHDADSSILSSIMRIMIRIINEYSNYML